MAKIPQFTSEQEEAEFWATHDSTPYLEDTEAIEVSFEDARRRKTEISLHLDAESVAELEAVARRKGVGFEALVRLWVMERLAREQSAG